MFRTKYAVYLLVFIGLALAVLASGAPASRVLTAQARSSVDCTLLDNPAKRGLMSAMFERRLLAACGRLNELPEAANVAPVSPLFPTLTDVPVNDPSGDTGATSHTQSETSISVNTDTGTICSAYNDSYSGIFQGTGFTGFSRSVDGGATFQDRGAFDGNSYGDPSVVWRRTDGYFYMATIHAVFGMGLWRSTDDCMTFQFMGGIPVGDDKELMAIDNNLASPYYGRIYVASTNFGAGGQIYSVYSDDGTNWSTAVALSDAGTDVQGAWPTVAPNGDVYVSWVHWDAYPGGTIDIQVTRSTNGGVSYTRTADALDNVDNPRDASATAACGRPALNGDIRYLPSPQIAVDPSDVVSVVYSYDPDGYNVGDVINVYYRRSLDHGATWQTEVKLNDDATTTDQWFPALSVSGAAISASWYDRRLDTAGNYLYTYWNRVSFDGGVTWQPSQQISDVQSPVYIDPQLNTCYHGDYDQQTQFDGAILIQWSDDRNVQSGHNDPDVYFEKKFVRPDFKLDATPSSQNICVPDPANYNVDLAQVVDFSQPVSLTVQGVPAGVLSQFTNNPVVPPGTSVLQLDTTLGAAGSYNLVVTGQAITLTHAVTVGLNLYTAVPGAPQLLTPAAEERNVSIRPTFTWQADQGKVYDIEVATDAAFTNIILTAVGLDTPSYTPSVDLPYNAVLYWRVMAHNTCGDSNWSTAERFVTEATLGQCAQGTTPATVLGQDFENVNPTGWTTGGTGSTWASSLVRKHSGSRSFKGIDTDTVSDQWLVSPAVQLPTAQAPLILSFWGYRKFQPSGGFDGGVVEISTDGGTTWTALNSQLKAGQYDGTITSATNPLYGQDAWTTPQTTWINTIADLDEFAGQTVQFRFRLGTDDSISYEGWYVDDVNVQACMPSTALGPDSNLVGNPGASVLHTFVLKNQSSTQDSFALSLSGNTWPTTLVSASPVTVTAGATATVSVRVDVPVNFITLSDSFTVTATSLGIPGISVNATGKTSLDIQPAAALSADQNGGGQPGQVVAYTFTLTNTGNFTDTFTLSTSGTWNALLPDGTSTGPLAAGQSITVTLLVAIPSNAMVGDTDVTSLTATSSLDTNVSVVAQATTMVFYRNYLPVVEK